MTQERVAIAEVSNYLAVRLKGAWPPAVNYCSGRYCCSVVI